MFLLLIFFILAFKNAYSSVQEHLLQEAPHSVIEESPFISNSPIKKESCSALQGADDFTSAYELFATTDPSQPQHALAAARLYIQLNEKGKAIILLKEALKIHPNDQDLIVVLAYAELFNSDLNSSRDLFLTVINMNPHNTDALAGLGRIADLKGYLEDANEYYQRALKIDPKHETALIYLGQLRIKQKRYEEAKSIFSGLIQRCVKDPAVYIGIRQAEQGLVDKEFEDNMRSKAESSMKEQQFEKALLQYELLVTYYPNNTEYLFQIAQLYRRLGRNIEAIPIYKKILNLHPNDIDSLTALAYADLAEQDIEASQELFKTVLKQNSSHIEALVGLGRIALHKNHLQEAEEYLERAFEIAPRDKMVLTYFARLRIQQKRYEEAKEIYEKILKEDPHDEDIQKALKSLEKNLASELEILIRDNPKEAVAKLRELIRIYPNQIHFKLQLAQLYKQLDELSEAIKIYEELHKNQPDNQDVLVSLGWVEMLYNNWGSAKERFQNVIEINPKNSEALGGLAQIEIFHNHLSKAEEYVNKALEINPTSEQVLIALGELRLKQKEYLEAKNIFTNLIQNFPHNQLIRKELIEVENNFLNEAKTLAKEHKFQEAVIRYQQLLSVYPANAEYLIELGRLYMHLRKTQEALDTYQKALDLDPKNSDIAIALAYAYLANQNLASSQQLFEKLLAQYPKNQEALTGMGRIFTLKNDLEKAESYLQESLSINANDETALIYLAGLQMIQHNYAEAKSIYTHLVELNPDDCDIQQGLITADRALKDDIMNRINEKKKLEHAIHLATEPITVEPTFIDASQTQIEICNFYFSRRNQSFRAEDFYFLSLLYIKAGDLEKAIFFLLKALDENCYFTQAHIQLGYVFLWQQDYMLAYLYFLEALKNTPCEKKSLEGLEVIAHYWEKFDCSREHAVAIYSNLLRCVPRQADYLFYQGRLLFWMHRWEEAEERLIATLIAAPQYFDAVEILGNIYIQEKRWEDATRLYMAYLYKPEARLGLAKIAMLNKNYETAEEWYRSILEKDSAQSEARLGLSRALAAQIEFQQAGEQLDILCYKNFCYDSLLAEIFDVKSHTHLAAQFKFLYAVSREDNPRLETPAVKTLYFREELGGFIPLTNQWRLDGSQILYHQKETRLISPKTANYNVYLNGASLSSHYNFDKNWIWNANLNIFYAKGYEKENYPFVTTTSLEAGTDIRYITENSISILAAFYDSMIVKNFKKIQSTLLRRVNLQANFSYTFTNYCLHPHVEGWLWHTIYQDHLHNQQADQAIQGIFRLPYFSDYFSASYLFEHSSFAYLSTSYQSYKNQWRHTVGIQFHTQLPCNGYFETTYAHRWKWTEHLFLPLNNTVYVANHLFLYSNKISFLLSYRINPFRFFYCLLFEQLFCEFTGYYFWESLPDSAWSIKGNLTGQF